jgi:hypothetical protein
VIVRARRVCTKYTLPTPSTQPNRGWPSLWSPALTSCSGRCQIMMAVDGKLHHMESELTERMRHLAGGHGRVADGEVEVRTVVRRGRHRLINAVSLFLILTASHRDVRVRVCLFGQAMEQRVLRTVKDGTERLLMSEVSRLRHELKMGFSNGQPLKMMGHLQVPAPTDTFTTPAPNASPAPRWDEVRTPFAVHKRQLHSLSYSRHLIRLAGACDAGELQTRSYQLPLSIPTIEGRQQRAIACDVDVAARNAEFRASALARRYSQSSESSEFSAIGYHSITAPMQRHGGCLDCHGRGSVPLVTPSLRTRGARSERPARAHVQEVQGNNLYRYLYNMPV